MKCLKASTLISIVASAGALVAVSASAKAAVTGTSINIVGASQCVYSSGAVPKLSGNGNLYNSSTTATSVVICPVDLPYSGMESEDIIGVEMTYTDKSTGGNISCTLSHVTDNGVTLTNGTAAASTGSTTTGGVLTLNAPASVTGGRLFVKCTLPKKGGSSALLSGYEVYQVVVGP